MESLDSTGAHSTPPRLSQAESEIRNRIALRGSITFAEFMELALYHPEGYYPRHARIGASGDYFTSPLLHPAFGALLAVQLQIMWTTLNKPSPFWVIEPGSANGLLAADIISFARANMNKFADALRYVEVDRSLNMNNHPYTPPSRLQSSGLPFRGGVGCILSNELFDAFPVHRFRIENGQVQEAYVSLGSDNRLCEEYRSPSTNRIADRLSSLSMNLPDGFQGEVNLSIENWMTDAAATLDRGYVLTIDYGHEADELYSDARARGSIQTYYKHVDGSSPYQRVGRQDITARVDFSTLIASGLNAGLRPVFLTTQAEFLESLGFRAMLASLRSGDLERPVEMANMRAMRELVKPDGLGKFKVLVQEKNSGLERSSDLLPNPERLARVRAPLMTANHLYAGPPPVSVSAFDNLWPTNSAI